MTNHIPDGRELADEMQRLQDIADNTADGTPCGNSETQAAFDDYVQENLSSILSALRTTALPKQAPGHTDLMVSPESIDAFMEKNPLPKQADPSREEIKRRLKWGTYIIGANWTTQEKATEKLLDAICVLLAAKPVDDGVRKAAFLECAAIAKKGAKQCSEGDSDWHRGFKYAANATALDIADSITLAALSPPSPGERT